MIEEIKDVVEEVCKKYGYDSEDKENNDSLKTVLLKAVTAMLKDANQEERNLFYQMLRHTPIVITENLTKEGYKKLVEQYIGNINPHIIKEDIDLGEYGKTEEIKINQDVENVKQILSDYYSSELGYLTTDGEVYAIDINQQTNQVEIELIASGVTKAEGAYYVKDGSTYYMNGTLALNEEFEQAQSNTFTIGNKIYARRYFSNIIEIKLAAEDFKSYMPIYSDEYDTTYISTNGELKNFSGVIIPEGTKYQENNTVINKVPLTINSEDTLCWGDLEYLTEVEDVTSVIIPDNDPYKADDIFAIAVRKDGTIWTKDFYELTNFKKVISPKDCEEEVQLGNIDDDNVVTIKDVKLSLQYSLGKTDLSDVQIKAADVNEDGIVNIKDVKLILQYSLKLISEF